MAKPPKQPLEISLESILWNCRNELRGIGGTDNKRDAVIGLVFLKFAGDKFYKRRREIKIECGDDKGLLKILLEKPSAYNATTCFICEKPRGGSILKRMPVPMTLLSSLIPQ
jgi:type I restriction enzyme M protein